MFRRLGVNVESRVIAAEGAIFLADDGGLKHHDRIPTGVVELLQARWNLFRADHGTVESLPEPLEDLMQLVCP